MITGRSAATLRSIHLARATDPVEIVVPLDSRIARRSGVDVGRSDVAANESTPWSRIGCATPLRLTLDLLLDRALPNAVADLDTVLRAELIDLDAVQRMVTQRSDRGIVAARRAVELADPRAESPPESRLRVHLVLDGLEPEPQYLICDWQGVVARADLGFLISGSPWNTTANGTANGDRSVPIGYGSTGYKPRAGTSSSSPPANYATPAAWSLRSAPPSRHAPTNYPDMSPCRGKGMVSGVGWWWSAN